MNEQAVQTLTSELELERHRLGELPPEAARQVQFRIESDAALRARLDLLARSDAELDERWATALARGVRNRLGSERPVRPTPRRRLWPALAAGAAACAALALHLVAPMTSTGPAPGGDRVTIKGGGPRLVLFRKTASGSEALQDGAVARRGDLIRLGYRSAGQRYGAILSLDGRGAVTWHLPPRGATSVPLTSGDTILLDAAYELDDAPGFERFHFVTADAPFDLAAALALVQPNPQAAAPAATLVRPAPSLEHSAFALRKDVP